MFTRGKHLSSNELILQNSKSGCSFLGMFSEMFFPTSAFFRRNQIISHHFWGKIRYFLDQHFAIFWHFLAITTSTHSTVPTSQRGHSDVARALLQNGATDLDQDGNRPGFFTLPIYLGGGFKDFLFSPLPGEMIQSD